MQAKHKATKHQKFRPYVYEPSECRTRVQQQTQLLHPIK
jgi:hypothetical protein